MDVPSSSKQANRSKYRNSQHKKSCHAPSKKVQKGKQQQSRKQSEAHNKNPTDEDYSNKLLGQPECRFADINDDSNEKEYDKGKSFNELLDVPLSASSFMFKDEKKWEWTESPFSNYFSIDMQHLAKVLDCIPFNEYMPIEDKYFTKDDITLMNSAAQLAKKEYLEELKVLKQLESPKATKNTSESKDSNSDDETDELDFLLSLKEPVRTLPTQMPTREILNNEDFKPKTTATTSTKCVDLEKWLDSIIDD